ncbi:uncharacterized protein LOC120325965 [Styela clava]
MTFVWQLRKVLHTSHLKILTIRSSSSPQTHLSCHQHLSDTSFPSSHLSLQQNRFCSSSTSNQQKNKKSLWDDSDWMNQNDSNAEAYSELDITKLKPFPEFRNVATGAVWGSNAYEKVWGPYYRKKSPDAMFKKQNSLWKKFVIDNGFEPTEYFSSLDFKDKYGDRLVWEDYRRNHKGSRPIQTTRNSCIYNNKMQTGSPCPICRDEKLFVSYKNMILLNHFIDPYSGNVHHNLRTGVCRRKQKLLEASVALARELGLLAKPMPLSFKQRLDSYRVDHPAVWPLADTSDVSADTTDVPANTTDVSVDTTDVSD